MNAWTREQLQAVTAANPTILVSAGAGSGKTAVLVERIVTLVKQGSRISRMLIVTFTRAAAAEMRQRLNQRLMQEKDGGGERIFQALDDLETAEIGTIHSFCGNLLRKYFQAVSVDPNYQICDDTRKKLLFRQAWTEVMNRLLPEQDEAVAWIARSYGIAELEEMTEKLYEFLMSMPHPFRWAREKLAELEAEDYRSASWYRELEAMLPVFAGEIRAILGEEEKAAESLGTPSRLKAAEEDRADMEAFLDRLLSGEAERQALLAAYAFPGLPRAGKGEIPEEMKEADERYKKLRDKRKEKIAELRKLFLAEPEATRADLRAVRTAVAGLLRITEEAAGRFMELKREQNLLNYEDLEQLTLQLMEEPAIIGEIRASFDHLFVDECQDVSAIQDTIFQTLHGDGSVLFMVGDVKQSIYRFRKAEPSLFLNRIRCFSAEGDAPERKIILQRNFRSNPGVIDAVNTVFRSVMRKGATAMDYGDEERLIAARDESKEKVRCVPVYTDSGRKKDVLEEQARETARIIRQLAGTGQYQYRDCVILLPAAAHRIHRIEQILEDAGIPVFSDYQEEAAFEPEITAMLELMKVIRNPYQDYPLLAALRMTPFLFTEGELGDVRLSGRGEESFWACLSQKAEAEDPLGLRCRQALETLSGWRFRYRHMPFADYVWFLMKESGLFTISGALPRGSDRQGSLALLSQKAEQYAEAGGCDLGEFVSLMEEMQSGRDGISARTLGEKENVVRIMTIHKSKGLEFPVVFLMGLNESLIQKDSGDLKCSMKLGICLPVIDPENRTRHGSMMETALEAERKREERAEKARLLYVAMTRPRDRLYLLLQDVEAEPEEWRLPPGDYRIREAKTYQDWLMQVVLENGGSDFTSAAAGEEAEPEEKRDRTDVWSWLNDSMLASDSTDLDAWRERTAENANRSKLKTSVTSIAKRRLAIPDEEQTEEDQRYKQVDEARRGMRLSEIPDLPQFLEASRKSSADRGTALHQALSLLDLDALRACGDIRAEVAAQMQRLIDEGILDGELIRNEEIRMIAGFFLHSLGQRLLKSPEVHREWSFNYAMPGERTLLQGVIDGAFLNEEGRWVLFDYKSDRIDDEAAFVSRYALQLSLYRQALEAITGIPVAEVWLYSLRLGRAFPV